MKDYYEILEVSKNASQDTINKVFKMHMKANHPDLFQGEEKLKAEAKSKEYTEAYNILSDANERAKYDAQLTEEQENTYSPKIQAIIEENEYLKRELEKKNNILNTLANSGYIEQPLYDSYDNPISSPEFSNQNPYQHNYNGPRTNPYDGLSLEELQKLKREETKQYLLQKFKDVGIKLIILVLIIIVMLISMFSSFNDLTELIK